MYEVHSESGSPSKELLRLREKVYRDEVGYLTDERLTSPDDSKGVHFVVKSGNDFIGAVHVLPANSSTEFIESSGIHANMLADAVHITRCYVHPEHRKSGCFRLALYFALRQARIMGRKRLVCIVEDGDIAAKRLVRYDYLTGCKPYKVQGNGGKYFEMRFATKPIDEAIYHCYSGLCDDQKKLVEPHFVQEVSDILARRSASFIINCPWVQKILDRTLTRDQYINSLSNMYQFVRDTTRVIARAASITESPKIRKHLIEHLQGEVDHEVQIESDLRHLNVDVDFVKNHFTPAEGVNKFRFIQEALLGVRNDPELYIAVPFCIEAFSSMLDHKFLNALEDCIVSWGPYQPRRASTFIRVHIEEDGGDGGHWDNNLKVLRHVLTSERRTAQFINVIHITMDAIEQMYREFCECGLVSEVALNSSFSRKSISIESNVSA